MRDKIFDMVAKTRRHVEIDLRFILSQIKLGIQLIERSNKANREYEDEFGKPDSEDEDDEAFQARLERQEGAKRAKALQVYKVRQDIARKLVLADRMQTFDTARIWTTVPYEMNAFAEDGNPLDDQDQWEWASTSTRVSTQYSTTVASSRLVSSSPCASGTASPASCCILILIGLSCQSMQPPIQVTSFKVKIGLASSCARLVPWVERSYSPFFYARGPASGSIGLSLLCLTVMFLLHRCPVGTRVDRGER